MAAVEKQVVWELENFVHQMWKVEEQREEQKLVHWVEKKKEQRRVEEVASKRHVEEDALVLSWERSPIESKPDLERTLLGQQWQQQHRY